jgi:magnesium-transporting ATPase (P-type)
VIQFTGKLFALLEEGVSTLFSIFFSLFEHYRNAKQAIISATQMANDVKTNLQDTSGCKVSLWRNDTKEWVATVAGEILPGDIFRFDDMCHKDRPNLIVPVDALVVKGQCLTNEAILTGESIPQVKIPFDFDAELHDDASVGAEMGLALGAEDMRTLDLYKDRASILFAGTSLLFVPTDGLDEDKDYFGVTCVALRTGTYSSKGRLVKALRGSAHAGAISNAQSDKDALRLIISLASCAVLSCASLFVRRDDSLAKVSPFRRVTQCTRIILSSIPAQIPSALASVARSCSSVLRRESDVVCSEPGSLLTAAYVDTVVFDKVRIVVLTKWTATFQLRLCVACHVSVTTFLTFGPGYRSRQELLPQTHSHSRNLYQSERRLKSLRDSNDVYWLVRILSFNSRMMKLGKQQ